VVPPRKSLAPYSDSLAFVTKKLQLIAIPEGGHRRDECYACHAMRPTLPSLSRLTCRVADVGFKTPLI
jgi:hypothetical protein